MAMAASSADMVALAGRLNWPRVQLTRAVSVGPGRSAWLLFGALATGTRIEQAYTALLALADDPPEPLSPRLV